MPSQQGGEGQTSRTYPSGKKPVGEIIRMPENLEEDHMEAEPLASGDSTMLAPLGMSADSPVLRKREAAGVLWELTSLLEMGEFLAGE
jgi:hypothetical protein